MAAKNPTLDALRAAPGRKKLSVIVTTFNEEINVAECLESVLWADEIVLVDSFSTDRTVEIARTFPITVLQRQYFGSAAQKNWALDRVQHEWVLIIDADERVPEALAREVLTVLASDPAIDGFYIRRENVFIDRACTSSRAILSPKVAYTRWWRAIRRVPSNSGETMTAYQWRPSPSRVM